MARSNRKSPPSGEPFAFEISWFEPSYMLSVNQPAHEEGPW